VLRARRYEAHTHQKSLDSIFVCLRWLVKRCRWAAFVGPHYESGGVAQCEIVRHRKLDELESFLSQWTRRVRLRECPPSQPAALLWVVPAACGDRRGARGAAPALAARALRGVQTAGACQQAQK